MTDEKKSENKDNLAAFDDNAATAEMDRYSRQIAALGSDTMKNLASLDVLIIGLRGVGAETAKNLILTGPRSVTLYDDGIVDIADLGANFYLRQEHVGKVSRTQASVKQFAELNPFCSVKAHTGEIPDKFIQTFGVVVVTETLSKDELTRINTACRKRKIKLKKFPVGFILANTHGVCGHIFTDFGANHTVNDQDGEPSRSMVVDKFIVNCDGDGKFISNQIKIMGQRHGFDDGDLIEFEDFEDDTSGASDSKSDDSDISLPCSKLNNLKGLKVKRIYFKYMAKDDDGKEQERTKQQFDTFEIDLSQTELNGKKFINWKTGGIVNQIKQKATINFRSLEDTLSVPATEGLQSFYGPQHPDQGEWETGGGKLLHLLFATALTFEQFKKHFPRLHNIEDAELFLKIFKQSNEANASMKDQVDNICYVENFDESRVKSYALFFPIELTGYCAFLGGVAAQEVVKRFGKYTPINQWLHTDHKQLLPKDAQVPSDAVPQNSRYDHQIALFGKKFQKLLAKQKIFLVGCGALGCEYLKGLAMMGVATGENGKVWCTDMDRIEVSNLSRQFLFRSQHVGKQKSITAANSAKEMNSNFNIEALEMKVWPETENFFTDHFWDNLDLCWNALDNVQARKYTDAKCLLHLKPLLESGTQGTKCNSEVIIPFKTKTYNDGVETEAAGIPMCTLQNFPYLPVHCIEWSRSSFARFENIPLLYNSYLTDKNNFYSQVETAGDKEKLQMLTNVSKLLKISNSKPTFKDCIQLAFDEFYQQHIKRIKDFVFLFPENEDVKDKDTGEVLGKFWTGHKRFPAIPTFDITQQEIFSYMHTSSNLWAFVFGLDYIRDKDSFLKALTAANLSEPEWTEPQNLHIETDPNSNKTEIEDEKDTADQKDSIQSKINTLKDEIEQIDSTKCQKLITHDFEKDDDTNFHIDYITAVANCRADNYRIKKQTRHECKIIAGKIIAALATTTAMICGLVELEFYKLKMCLEYSDEHSFYNANINLGVAQFQYFQPDDALKHCERKEFDETMQCDLTKKPFPPKWTTWDHIVINENKQSLTVAQFQNAIENLAPGLKITRLAGYKVSEGGNICDIFGSTAQNIKPLEDKVTNATSKGHKVMAQQNLDRAIKKNKKIKEVMNAKVIDIYLNNYCKENKLVSDDRSYVLLEGDFQWDDAEQSTAELPYIKYYFK